MAVIALALVGGAIGTAVGGTAAIAFGITAGAIGTAVGAAVGGYLDSQYIIPALFSKGDQSYVGPRIDDLSIQTASEGSPIKRVYGVKNKVAGTVIWISDLIEESTTQSSGGGKGGGGGGVSSTTFATTSTLPSLSVKVKSTTSQPSTPTARKSTLAA